MDWERGATLYRFQVWLERPALVEAVALAGPRRSDRAVDLGTGTGAFLRELARAPDPPESVVGVDTSAAMLAQAGELPTGWRLMQADARALPFEDGCVDLLVTAYLLHVVAADERAAILAEARRVLSRRGRLVSVTPAAPRSRVGRRVVQSICGHGRRAGGLGAGLCPLDPRPELEGAGFVVRVARYVARGYRSWCVLAEPPRR